MMLGMAAVSEPREVPGGMLEQLGERHRALRTPDQVEHADPVAVAIDDEGPARALPARVGQRLLERPADDVPRDGPPEVAESARQGESARLVGGEVDHEEV